MFRENKLFLMEAWARAVEKHFSNCTQSSLVGMEFSGESEG
jgi:hypothetical protein